MVRVLTGGLWCLQVSLASPYTIPDELLPLHADVRLSVRNGGQGVGRAVPEGDDRERGDARCGASFASDDLEFYLSASPRVRFYGFKALFVEVVRSSCAASVSLVLVPGSDVQVCDRRREEQVEVSLSPDVDHPEIQFPGEIDTNDATDKCLSVSLSLTMHIYYYICSIGILKYLGFFICSTSFHGRGTPSMI